MKAKQAQPSLYVGLTAHQRAQILTSAIPAVSQSCEDASSAEHVLTHLCKSAPRLDARNMLQGPTGETNEWYLTARGKTLIIGLTSTPPAKVQVLAGLYAALLAGNEVVLHVPQLSDWCANLIGQLQQHGLPAALVDTANDAGWQTLLHMAELAMVVVVAAQTERMQIREQTAASEGMIKSIVELNHTHQPYLPNFLDDFATERVLTINTTAIGGNVDLIELESMGSD